MNKNYLRQLNFKIVKNLQLKTQSPSLSPFTNLHHHCRSGPLQPPKSRTRVPAFTISRESMCLHTLLPNRSSILLNRELQSRSSAPPKCIPFTYSLVGWMDVSLIHSQLPYRFASVAFVPCSASARLRRGLSYGTYNWFEL